MADVAEKAEELEELHRSHHLQAHAQRTAANAKLGRSECACGEPISEYRMRMGADKCVECATKWEKVNGY